MSNNIVGIVGLPDVRDALQELGVEVVSGDTFPEASRRIREAAKSPNLPVLIEDHKQLGLPQLISRIEQSSTVVIVRRDSPVLEDHWSSVPISSSLGSYLRTAGIEDIDPLLDDIYVDADGKISEDSSATPGPSISLAEQDREPSAANSPAPAVDSGDWLSDEDDNTAPDEHPEPPKPSPELAATSAEASQVGWLSDEEEDDELELTPAAPLSKAPPEEDEDEEDFEGLFTPQPSRAAEPQHPQGGEAPASQRTDEPDPEKNGRRIAEGIPQSTRPAPEPTRRPRRRISLPAFTGEDAETSPENDVSAPSPVDEEMSVDVHDEEPDHDEDSYDIDDVLEDSLAPRTSRSVRRLNAPLGLVIVSFAGKGGVGKSTVSLCLAQAAAEIGGLTVCLIDANRGQGDLGLYLKVRKSDLPSIYDAVTIGDLNSAILSPEAIAAARSGTGDRIAFSFVQAPRPMHDGELSHEIAVVRPEHYAEVVRLAREQFDLVIIDTQITEGLDTSGVIDHAIGPVLGGGGYGLGIAEFTTVGVENLMIATAYLRSAGADSARMMSIANRISPSVGDYGKLPQLLGRESKWKGAIHLDDRIKDDMRSRHVPYTVPTMRDVVLDVLHSVTGLAEFSKRDSSEPAKAKPPFWKRWFLR